MMNTELFFLTDVQIVRTSWLFAVVCTSAAFWQGDLTVSLRRLKFFNVGLVCLGLKT